MAVEDAQDLDSPLSLVRTLCSVFVGQLLQGCHDQACTLPSCLTGRTRTATRPVRRYTPRSARALALSMASSPDPRKYLCRRYLEKISGTEGITIHDGDEGPRDPSSLTQQLCDTPAVRNHFFNGDNKLDIDRLVRSLSTGWNWQGYRDGELCDLHANLDSAAGLPFINGQANVSFLSNDRVGGIVSDCLLWLLRKSPASAQYIEWLIAQRLVGGNAAQTSFCNRTITEILKFFMDPQARLLMDRTLKCVSYRLALNDSLASSGNNSHATRAHGVLDPLHPRLKAWTVKYKSNEPCEIGYVIATVAWLKNAFLRHWDGNPLVTRGTAACGALELLEHITRDSENASKKHHFESIANLISAVDLVQDWMREDLDMLCQRHLLSFPFLFTPAQLEYFFRVYNHLKMRKAYNEAAKAVEIRRRLLRARRYNTVNDDQLQFLEQHYLLLTVSRNGTLHDAFNQVWRRRLCELLRPLRVRLGEIEGLEVGHDFGGVQTEFFNLICKGIFNDDLGMFTTDQDTGMSYFKPFSLQPLYHFELIGVLLSIAIYNGITLPICMPLALYRHILGLPCDSIASIEDGWTAVSRSLASILESDSAMEGLDYVFPIDANGMRLSIVEFELSADITQSADWPSNVLKYDGANRGSIQDASCRNEEHCASGERESDNIAPGWIASPHTTGTVPLTTANKEAFVRHYCHCLTTSSVWPQLQAFKRGFFTCIDRKSLTLFNPNSLQAFVEGSQHIDLESLQRATTYHGFDPWSDCIEWFWQIMMAWGEEQQKRLIKFVTAVERIPVNGALTFCIKKAVGVDTSNLPTSSTCFGTLHLPVYESREILESKLNLAIEFGLEGFGTG